MLIYNSTKILFLCSIYKQPPPRNHETSNSSFNDSKESNEISEAECDRDNGPRGNYGGLILKFSY